MKASLDTVRDYFDREASRFDAIYDTRKPWHQRLVDRAFRRVVTERFRLICNLAPLRSPWTVLDVGCGSGRYSLALARIGAERVVGVDVADSMIELATAEAINAKLQDRIDFFVSPFLDFASTRQFDVAVATGYFDYLEDPLPHMKKMVALTRLRVFATFPKRWEFRVPVRKLRFAIERGFVRFYSRPEVLHLVQEAGFPADHVSLIDLGRDWVAVLRVPG